MEILIAIVIMVVIVLFVLNAMKGDKSKKEKQTTKSTKTEIKSSHLMTAHEKTMFGELKQSVPECHIFVQVALGAILWTSSYATRNKFSQKIADFVITDQNFKILAVIELDDKSHNGKEAKDAERDEMLREAGYKVLRYPVMPPKNQLRSDILS
ncbi:DUF2726 domain-containing protein [Psychrobacter sp. ANT_H56B]|uniref:DUF2726 domain-containing protein n=1 Tax=Psychrobacter sp. ANT_H56B TaxID=2597353 RepID=UPI0011F282B9|nr:DUF2726 domain-containing protein [Psychrobacter sp. ANT_H56B]KAA0924793.1 DUF2726 domain-containing protein [Psychrobacter sp. ANT_H56B]